MQRSVAVSLTRMEGFCSCLPRVIDVQALSLLLQWVGVDEPAKTDTNAFWHTWSGG
jgi:hypothetical protein